MPQREVVIAGGGPAALEAVMALRELAADRVAVTLVCPEREFVLRALTVATPFASGHVLRRPLDAFAERFGATLRHDAVASVDPEGRAVVLASGERLAYDACMLAIGGRPVAAFGHALTFGTERDPEALNGLLADLEGHWTRKVAFVVPSGVTWPLPLYELALQTARQVRSMGIDDAEITLVTPEQAPLDAFGPRASAAVRGLLDEGGIAFVGGAEPTVERGGRVRLGPGGEELRVDRVVALPVLDGPRLRGAPRDADGFIPVDELCRVAGTEGLYACGDGADFPLKQGGLATQQADVAAADIARAAGADVEVAPFRAVLRGKLITGAGEQFLTDSATGQQPLWWPPTKIAGRHLGPWLAEQDAGGTAPPEPASAPGVDVEVALSRDDARALALALDPLGALPHHGRW